MARGFDGVDDSIAFGSKAEFKILGDLSWAGWLKFTSLTSNMDLPVIIEGGATEIEAHNQILNIQILGSNNTWDIQYIHEHGAGINETNRFDTNLAEDTWIHIAVVRDVSAKTVILYLDGVAFGTFNYTNDPTNTSSALDYRLGERINGGFDFGGVLAETVLANVAWSAGEVHTVQYRASRARGIVHYVPLFGAGSPEPDYSGNGNNGTITGTTQVDHPPVALPFGFDIDISVSGGGAPPPEKSVKLVRGLARKIVNGVVHSVMGRDE